MTTTTRRQFLGASASLALSATAIPASAAAWPSQPLRIIVPFAPGGATDVLARMLAERLRPLLNQTVVIENRGGAAGSLGTEIAAKSPIAVTGTKAMISYMRDHTVNDGLEYVATWNAAMLQSNDLRVAIAAHMSKQKPEFVD